MLHYLGQEGQIRNGAVEVEIIWTKGRFLEANGSRDIKHSRMSVLYPQYN